MLQQLSSEFCHLLQIMDSGSVWTLTGSVWTRSKLLKIESESVVDNHVYFYPVDLWLTERGGKKSRSISKASLGRAEPS